MAIVEDIPIRTSGGLAPNIAPLCRFNNLPKFVKSYITGKTFQKTPSPITPKIIISQIYYRQILNQLKLILINTLYFTP